MSQLNVDGVRFRVTREELKKHLEDRVKFFDLRLTEFPQEAYVGWNEILEKRRLFEFALAHLEDGLAYSLSQEELKKFELI